MREKSVAREACNGRTYDIDDAERMCALFLEVFKRLDSVGSFTGLRYKYVQRSFVDMYWAGKKFARDYCT